MTRRLAATIGAAALLAVATVPVRAQLLEALPEVPVASTELARGTFEIEGLPPVQPSEKTIDGDPSDWVGDPSGFGGTTVRSAGEVIYQDHLFDARGADDGTDAERLAVLGPLEEGAPHTYRLEALIGQDPPSQFGVDSPAPLKGEEHYGDAGLQGVADIVEVRLAPSAEGLALLVRTTTMHAASEPAVLVLLDREPGDTVLSVPFASGLATSRAETAILLSDAGGRVADLASGEETALPAGSVAVDPSGWTNTLEGVLPWGLVGEEEPVTLALAAGISTGTGDLAELAGTSNVANVAFRSDAVAEPVRTWFDRTQALDLHAGTIDRFFTTVDVSSLSSGTSERLVPGPGYHDRIFRSADALSDETDTEGVWQHYGLYLPDDFEASVAHPLQWWLHWRGGHAHSAAAVIPRMFRTLGDGEAAGPLTTGIADSIVVAPRGRGTSTWYVGIGHADVLEVWEDVFGLYGASIDDERVYVTGHSMGGWGSWLLPILYPDRFAASVPYAGPVTQGAWTGLDFPGCDDYKMDDYTPCYIEANGSRPRDQHTRRLLENLRHVPVAVMHGAADELVPVSGVSRQVERLIELGYRHRYYLFPTYEHFSHPVVDEWAEGGRYAHGFRRPANPARVTYVRDPAFERATEEVQARDRQFDFAFDRAYWMHGLEPASVTAPARFEGLSLAVSSSDTLSAPEAGGPSAPGQYGPFTMTGLRWIDDALSESEPESNGFRVELTGARAVTLDLESMAIDAGDRIDGFVTTDGPLTLRLDGDWESEPVVACDCGAPPATRLVGGVLEIDLAPGSTHLTVA